MLSPLGILTCSAPTMHLQWNSPLQSSPPSWQPSLSCEWCHSPPSYSKQKSQVPPFPSLPHQPHQQHVLLTSFRSFPQGPHPSAVNANTLASSLYPLSPGDCRSQCTGFSYVFSLLPRTLSLYTGQNDPESESVSHSVGSDSLRTPGL